MKNFDYDKTNGDNPAPAPPPVQSETEDRVWKVIYAGVALAVVGFVGFRITPTIASYLHDPWQAAYPAVILGALLLPLAAGLFGPEPVVRCAISMLKFAFFLTIGAVVGSAVFELSTGTASPVLGFLRSATGEGFAPL